MTAEPPAVSQNFGNKLYPTYPILKRVVSDLPRAETGGNQVIKGENKLIYSAFDVASPNRQFILDACVCCTSDARIHLQKNFHEGGACILTMKIPHGDRKVTNAYVTRAFQLRHDCDRAYPPSYGRTHLI